MAPGWVEGLELLSRFHEGSNLIHVLENDRLGAHRHGGSVANVKHGKENLGFNHFRQPVVSIKGGPKYRSL